MKKDSKSESSANLRQKTEELNKREPSPSGAMPDEVQMLKLIHELKTHQIELELRNQELLRAKAQITADAEKYAELYDFAPSGYFTLSKDGEILELNLFASQMLGKERTFLKNKLLNLYVSDDSKPIFNCFLDKVFSNKSKETCEVSLLANGELPMYVSLTGLATQNGERCMVTLVDLTARKKAEDTLALMASDWQTTFNAATDMIWLLDKEQQVVRSNKASERFCHRPVTELIGKPCWEIIHGTTEPIYDCPFRRATRSLQREVMELQLGDDWVEVAVDPILDAVGQYAGAVHIVKNITGRRRVEKIFEDQYALLIALINSPKDIIIFSLDKNYCYTTFNVKHREEMKRVWKIDIEVGMNLLDCMPVHELQKSAMQSINRALRGESFSEIQHQPEPDIYYELSWNPINKNNEVIGVTVFIRDITVRKQAEEALKLKNIVFDASIAANSIAGLDGKITEANDSFLRIWGYATREEVLGKPILHFINDPDDAIAILTALNEKDEWESDFTARKKDSSTFNAHGLATTIKDTNGKLIGYQSSVIDITERKQAEEALSESERKFRDTVINLDEGYYSVNMDGVLLDHNQAFSRILGFDQTTDLKGAHLPDFWMETNERIDYLNALTANGSISNYQINVKTHTGAGKTVLASAHLVKDKNNLPLRIEGIFLDITERIHIEEALHRHAGRLQNLHKIDKAILSPVETPEAIIQKALQHIRSLLSSQHASIGIFDFDKEILQLFCSNIKDESMDMAKKYLINNALEDLEILRKNKMDVVEDISKKSLPPELQRILQAEGIMSCINLPLVSGEKLIGVVNLGWTDPRTFTPEELEIASEVAVEITIAIEQIRLRQEAKHYAEELEKRVQERTSQLLVANKELEAFSYSVSHDLRAPLRHISGYISILSRRLQDILPEKEKYYLDTIADSAHQMGLLIDDLLHFSRTGRQEMQLTSLDMNAILQDALQVIKHESFGRGIKWVVEVLPQVYGDYALLKLVWLNLLSNAVKFSRSNVSTRIEVGVVDNMNEFIFFVRDNGVGFDMQYAHKLFGVFERLHSTQEFEGTGIGLANVRRIIVRHGGRTWAEAEVDKGATFYFSLPKR